VSRKKISSYFRSELFWDVDVDSIDVDRHARFVIERILTRGDLAEWKSLLALYGKKRICDEAVELRTLDPKSRNFLTVCFGIDKKAFRCCN